MKCSKCKNILRRETTNYIGVIDKKTVIIENTPIYICDNCLEQFYKEDVVKNVENMMEIITDLPIKTTLIDYKELIKYNHENNI